MPATLIRIFIYSAGALLFAMASAAFMTNWTTDGFVSAHDPIFLITIHSLFWIVGGVNLTIAMICLFGRQISLQLTLVLWLSVSLMYYHLGLPGGFKSIIGNLSDVFGITVDTTDDLFEIQVLYLLTGSCLSMLWLWLQKHSDKTIAHVKTACAHCGTHIKFDCQNLGQSIPCPQCQKTITLRKSDLLKMSCFFCREHIEFPIHAIGEKISCPHCKMGITLKESA
jgi:hypothetical protein